MIPQERGVNGLSIFIIFYLPILVLIEKSGYMSFLGEAMWFLVLSNYINPTCGLFGGSLGSYSPFTLTLFSLFHFGSSFF
jgi:hypothetical protein